MEFDNINILLFDIIMSYTDKINEIQKKHWNIHLILQI